ncbi:hypothetical protein MIND_01227300 [Mycena indigotica]|uniref:Uncharacterized protein n=1 Tax=Mycena indigotica TaxID=2126181 RepID=A0A8H6S4R2_9AGAR|nr:uncharacterized protein MIND_01227300 [Mycena indigotica]KAF7292016.1 hypothetical protein MIND_01227300 [Mycena indigotica]
MAETRGQRKSRAMDRFDHVAQQCECFDIQTHVPSLSSATTSQCLYCAIARSRHLPRARVRHDYVALAAIGYCPRIHRATFVQNDQQEPLKHLSFLVGTDITTAQTAMSRGSNLQASSSTSKTYPVPSQYLYDWLERLRHTEQENPHLPIDQPSHEGDSQSALAGVPDLPQPLDQYSRLSRGILPLISSTRANIHAAKKAAQAEVGASRHRQRKRRSRQVLAAPKPFYNATPDHDARARCPEDYIGQQEIPLVLGREVPCLLSLGPFSPREQDVIFDIESIIRATALWPEQQLIVDIIQLLRSSYASSPSPMPTNAPKRVYRNNDGIWRAFEPLRVAGLPQIEAHVMQKRGWPSKAEVADIFITLKMI